jgi:hypothetical protein
MLRIGIVGIGFMGIKKPALSSFSGVSAFPGY